MTAYLLRYAAAHLVQAGDRDGLIALPSAARARRQFIALGDHSAFLSELAGAVVAARRAPARLADLAWAAAVSASQQTAADELPIPALMALIRANRPDEALAAASLAGDAMARPAIAAPLVSALLEAGEIDHAAELARDAVWAVIAGRVLADSGDAPEQLPVLCKALYEATAVEPLTDLLHWAQETGDPVAPAGAAALMGLGVLDRAQACAAVAGIDPSRPAALADLAAALAELSAARGRAAAAAVAGETARALAADGSWRPDGTARCALRCAHAGERAGAATLVDALDAAMGRIDGGGIRDMLGAMELARAAEAAGRDAVAERWAQIAGERARTIHDEPGWNPFSLGTAVAEALCLRGVPDDAEATIARLERPDARAGAFTALAEAVHTAGDRRRALALLEAAERAAADGPGGDPQLDTARSVSAVLSAMGERARLSRRLDELRASGERLETVFIVATAVADAGDRAYAARTVTDAIAAVGDADVLVAHAITYYLPPVLSSLHPGDAERLARAGLRLLPEPEARAWLLGGTALTLIERGAVEPGIRLAGEALAAALDRTRDAATVAIRARIAEELHEAGRCDEARRIVHRELALAREVVDLGERATASARAGQALVIAGDRDGWAAAARAVAAVADPWKRARALEILAEPFAGRSDADAGRLLLAAVGDPASSWVRMLGLCAAVPALDAAQRRSVMDEVAGLHMSEARKRLLVALTPWLPADDLRRAVRLAGEIDDERYAWEVRAELARALVAAGEPAAARDLLRPEDVPAEGTGDDGVLAAMARVSAATGDLEIARQLAERAFASGVDADGSVTGAFIAAGAFGRALDAARTIERGSSVRTDAFRPLVQALVHDGDVTRARAAAREAFGWGSWLDDDLVHELAGAVDSSGLRDLVGEIVAADYVSARALAAVAVGGGADAIAAISPYVDSLAADDRARVLGACAGAAMRGGDLARALELTADALVAAGQAGLDSLVGALEVAIPVIRAHGGADELLALDRRLGEADEFWSEFRAVYA